MPSTIEKGKLFRIKHTILLQGETFLRNKHKIKFFLNKMHILWPSLLFLNFKNKLFQLFFILFVTDSIQISLCSVVLMIQNFVTWVICNYRFQLKYKSAISIVQARAPLVLYYERT